MLYDSLHHSEIYNPNRNSKSVLYYNNLINILKTVLEHGIIYLDKENYKVKRIKDNLNAWPPEFREKALELIKRIGKNNRFVRIDSQPSIFLNKDCKELCDDIANLIYSKPDVIISLLPCTKCLGKWQIEIVDHENFCCSNFFNNVIKNDIIISYKEFTKERLNSEVFNRIFKSCSSIKIIDRLIGSHIVNHPGDLNQNYKNGLEYLVSCLKSTNNSLISNFEIYTLIKDKDNIPIKFMDPSKKADLNNTIKNIEKFINDLNLKYSLNIKCHFKEDYGKFVHDRYILTNQMKIFIGRGFDLLDKNGIVRDNTIGVLRSEKNIDSQIRSLDDISMYL
jgi:hypothetical protein